MIRLSSRHAMRAAVKRTVDVVVAAIALAVLLPFLLLLALLVVVDSPGPVFYRATRAGFRGRTLHMLKFRKMHLGATGPVLITREDPWLTRVGAVLARTRLDELSAAVACPPRRDGPERPAAGGPAVRRALCRGVRRDSESRPGIAGWAQPRSPTSR